MPVLAAVDLCPGSAPTKINHQAEPQHVPRQEGRSVVWLLGQAGDVGTWTAGVPVATPVVMGPPAFRGAPGKHAQEDACHRAPNTGAPAPAAAPLAIAEATAQQQQPIPNLLPVPVLLLPKDCIPRTGMVPRVL